MCGISSVFRYTRISDTDIKKLFLMNKEMQYRGPDDSGIWHDLKCGMVQTRLSIIGLEKGKQPLFNEDKSLVLICNGEIYNYIELKKDLRTNNHFFSSDSDSETILHLYEEFGIKCLRHLRGMFVFCLWDTKINRLFVARDRIGEKILYYSQIPSGIVFSSELKAILKYYIDTPQINIEQLAAPIRYTTPTNKKNTYIEQIKRVEPGQYLLVDDTGIQKFQYWKREVKTKFSGSFFEAKNETLNLMCESVDICLRSDVPVAVLLSGGIDSSTVAALAKETRKEIHTITAGYKGQHACDERNDAKRFAKEKGLIYHEIELDKSDFKNCFEEFTQFIDEPICDIASFAQWALYKKTKEMGFKVLLGGLGGDELFYGYPYWNCLGESISLHRQHQKFFPWKGIDKKIAYMKFVLKNLKYILSAGYPLKISDSSISYWMHDDYTKFAETADFTNNDEKLCFRDIDLYYTFGNSEIGKEMDLVYNFACSFIMTMVFLYLADRLGMGNSMEIRSPLLDYKLVEFVSSLSIGIKYSKGQPKFFMKEVLKDIIPDYILNAKKRFFQPPTSFITEVVDNYNYQVFDAKHKFYNSILADRILYLNLKK